MNTALYLIPVTLGESSIEKVLPSHNADILNNLTYFIVENIRTARRFIKKVNPLADIDNMTFYELNKHTDRDSIDKYLEPLQKGISIGLMSEAGCPAIADPGSDIVAIAQQKGLTVVPLVGPSSILLSLMGSGFNGQGFSFHGYLPIDSSERNKKIKHLEKLIHNENQTQIFIETPYRNLKLVEELIRNCAPSTKLCIAVNITCDDEYIRTRTIKDWAKNIPDINKKPCIFLLYK